ncbi:MAG: 30S ribosomal protein S21 [Sumerlaeia bacterium]
MKTLLPTVVYVDQDEPIEKALKRFKKECQKAGIPAEIRRREFYEKPSEKKKRKLEASIRKHRRRIAKMRRREQNM